MENNQDTANTPATKGDFNKLAEELGGKIEHLFSEQTKATDQKLDDVKKDMEQLFADQADVILEAVEERMDKKLGEKFDPVITKLDAVLKGFDDHRGEDIAGAQQLRRHDDELKKHDARIGKLEIAATRA